MLGVLIKKQLAEVFRSYFYNAKKNKMRSKAGVVGFFIFFVLIMVGMLGGIFTFFALTMCSPLNEVGMGWMYYLLMGLIAVVLGAFGSIFNTYSGLYLAKDNDLLLSLPIPVRTIMAARLTNVYLLGAMYTATVLIPALIVGWVVGGATPARIICGILLFVISTVIVLLLSCVLGWVVAKISLRLKNKSFVTVLTSLLFIGGYYFFYFKANDYIRQIINNADVYGAKIKGGAYLLYLFGRIGEGDWLATAIYTVVTGILFAAVWYALSRSVLQIATASGTTAKVRYVEKAVKEKSVFGALLDKELRRFTSNANYMLNCGLGTILIPAIGILLLFKGREFCDLMGEVLSARPGSAAILLCTGLFMASAMNDIAAPSVSLEGKSLWIPQSLPVRAKTVLRVKACVQLLVTGVPMVLAAACAAVIVQASLAVKLLVFVLPLIYTAFSSLMNTMIGVRMPLLTWTNETAPIKQSGGVTIALFGSWAIGIVFAGLYMLLGYKIGAAAYLLVWVVIFAAAALVLLKWLDTKGAAEFEAL